MTERWGSPSKSFQFFTSVHARRKKKKRGKKKSNGDRGEHHNTWHTRNSAQKGFRVNTYTRYG